MKQYRQNAHIVPLVFWALLCAAVAGFLLVHSRKIVDRTLRLEEIAAGLGLLVLGPVALTVYLVRSNLVWVSLDPEQGVLVRGRHLIPWSEIERVERRRPRLRKGSGPPEIAAPSWVKNPGSCLDPVGCGGDFLAGALELAVVFVLVLALLVAFWFIFFVLIPLLVVPVLEVFAPFGDRVKIVARGRTLVLRDLSEADEFVRLVAARRPVLER